MWGLDTVISHMARRVKQEGSEPVGSSPLATSAATADAVGLSPRHTPTTAAWQRQLRLMIEPGTQHSPVLYVLRDRCAPTTTDCSLEIVVGDCAVRFDDHRAAIRFFIGTWQAVSGVRDEGEVPVDVESVDATTPTGPEFRYSLNLRLMGTPLVASVPLARVRGDDGTVAGIEVAIQRHLARGWLTREATSDDDDADTANGGYCGCPKRQRVTCDEQGRTVHTGVAE